MEFDEHSAGDATIERTYRTMTASTTGPDGEPVKVDGEAVGKTLRIRGGDEASVEVDGQALPARMAQGVPGAVSFAGMFPDKPVEVGSEFPVGGALHSVFAMAEHPFGGLRPRGQDNAAGRRGRGAPPEDGAQPPAPPKQGEPPQPGQPPQQGDRPQRGQRGQRGGQFGGAMRAAMAARDPAFMELSRLKLQPDATAKVVEVGEDGVAKIAFHGTIAGEGTPEDLGLGFGGGRRGGRGGRGAQQPDENAPQASAKIDVTFDGTALVDTHSHRLQKLVVEGKMSSSTTRTMNRRGESMQVDMKNDGPFSITITASPAPAAPTTGEASDQAKKQSD